MAKLGVVVFGASKFDNHRNLNNSRFANSAEQFLKTISNPEFLPDCVVTSLNLYNESFLPSETSFQVRRLRKSGFRPRHRLLFGDGDVSRRVREYSCFCEKRKGSSSAFVAQSRRSGCPLEKKLFIDRLVLSSTKMCAIANESLGTRQCSKRRYRWPATLFEGMRSLLLHDARRRSRRLNQALRMQKCELKKDRNRFRVFPNLTSTVSASS